MFQSALPVLRAYTGSELISVLVVTVLWVVVAVLVCLVLDFFCMSWVYQQPRGFDVVIPVAKRYQPPDDDYDVPPT